MVGTSGIDLHSDFKGTNVGLNLHRVKVLLRWITGANADLGDWLCKVLGICG